MADYETPKKGAAITQEKSDKHVPGSGVWRHPKSGAEVITIEDPLFGNAQAQAMQRLEYEYVGEAPEGAIKSLIPGSEDKENQPRTDGVNASDLKGVQARLDALEDENARLKNELEYGNPVPGTEEVPGTSDTKVAALNKLIQQEQPVASDQSGVVEQGAEVSDKALADQNKQELTATAQAEGVEVAPEHTKANIVEAIEAKRAEGAEAPADEEEGI